MKLFISFIRSVALGIVIYIFLKLSCQWLADGILFETLYGQGILENQEVLSSFENYQQFFNPILYGTISIGIGCLSFLFSSANQHRLSWIKGLLSLSFIGFLFLEGLSLYYLSDHLITDIQSVQSNDNAQTIEPVNQQTYPNIIVRADPELYAVDIEQIKAAIDSMPDFLLKECKNIYILDTEQYEKAGKELKMEDPSQTAAFSYSGDMSIRVRILNDPAVLNTYTRTMAHECSHIYDFSKGDAYDDPSGLSTSKEFIALYEKYPDSISEYGATNEYEFFAEAGGLYITDPGYLEQLNPEVYQYFDQLYGPHMA